MLVHQGHDELQSLVTRLVDSRPFLHQLDVVITGSVDDAERLSRLSTCYYYRRKLTFSALFDGYDSGARYVVGARDGTRSCRDLTALSVGTKDTESVWSLDTHGLLSLSPSYEHLGIVGTHSSRKYSKLVQLDLKDTSTLAVRARNALKGCDVRRQQTGEEEEHHVLLSSDFFPAVKCDVTSRVHSTNNVHVPSSIQDILPLFEWLGLASLHSERLLVNDKPNQYVSSYLPPDGCSIGSIHHLRWTGLLTPTFVQSILEQVFSCSGLRGISGISFDSPVSSQNYWSLILSEDNAPQGKKTQWLLVEKI